MAAMRNFLEISRLDSRRRQLGMSMAVLAKRSGVPMRTVQRILSGKHLGASIASVLALANALGMTVQIEPTIDAQDLKERQAQEKAKQLVNQVQATSALESQAIEPEAADRMIRQTELLGSSAKRSLWD